VHPAPGAFGSPLLEFWDMLRQMPVVLADHERIWENIEGTHPRLLVVVQFKTINVGLQASNLRPKGLVLLQQL